MGVGSGFVLDVANKAVGKFLGNFDVDRTPPAAPEDPTSSL